MKSFFYALAIFLPLMLYARATPAQAQFDVKDEARLPALEVKPIPFPGQDNDPDVQSYRFVMNYSTLAHTDSETPYQYLRCALRFPDNVLAEAKGETTIIRYRYAIRTPNARPDAQKSEDGRVIFRVVNARIPDSATAQKMVQRFTSTFQPPGNMQQVMAEFGATQDLPVSIDEFEPF